MSSKTRITIFIVCFLTFVIGAPLIILYSRGYRFDIQNKEITKTGGLFIKAKPNKVDVYLDKKPEKKTDLFFGSSFIKNLIPRKYSIKLEKENYHSWQKKLKIKEQTVTEINNISLIPKNPNRKTISKEIEELWFFPDKTKILLKEKTDDAWELKLYNFNKKLKSHLVKEDDFSTSSVEILDLNFSSDSQNILLKLGAKEQIKYYVLTIDPFPPKKENLTKLNNKQLDKITFNPNNSQEIIFQEEKQVYRYNIEDEKIKYYSSDLSEKDREIITFFLTHNNFTYLTYSGFIYDSYSKEKINKEELKVKRETKYEIKENSNFVFLLEKESGKLYAISKDKKEDNIKLLDENVNSFIFSPHNDKLAYSLDHTIKIFYLKEQSSQPFNKKGDKVFISRFANEISQLRWLNNHYLIFKANNSVKITETDNRDKINIINFLNFKKDFKLGWEPSSKELLIYVDKNLFSYGLPTF
ncbi:MAG: hypothetical protein ACOC1P_01320 [Minisyncoccales bacterium]